MPEPRYVQFVREYYAADRQKQIMLDAWRQLKTHIVNMDELAKEYNDWSKLHNGLGISEEDQGSRRPHRRTHRQQPNLA
jgi:hypothetical protein